jgi:hypothetical protein
MKKVMVTVLLTLSSALNSMDLAGYNDKVHCTLHNGDRVAWSIQEGKVAETYHKQVGSVRNNLQEIHKGALDHPEAIKGLATLLAMKSSPFFTDLRVKFGGGQGELHADEFKENLLEILERFSSPDRICKVKMDDLLESSGIMECIYHDVEFQKRNVKIYAEYLKAENEKLEAKNKQLFNELNVYRSSAKNHDPFFSASLQNDIFFQQRLQHAEIAASTVSRNLEVIEKKYEEKVDALTLENEQLKNKITVLKEIL